MKNNNRSIAARPRCGQGPGAPHLQGKPMKLVLALVTVGIACSAGEAFAQHGSIGPDALNTRGSWSRYDTNRDGTISSVELSAASQALAAQLQTQLLNRYDTNSD